MPPPTALDHLHATPAARTMRRSMVVDLRWHEQHAVEMETVRRQAGALLARLVACRDGAEEDADPMKLVTGRSALDGAIVMTRRIVAHTDELMRELDGDDAKLGV